MRPKTADELKQAIVLREAGYTLAAIVEQTGISPATLTRYFSKHCIRRGSLSTATVEQARQQLLEDPAFSESLKTQIAASILDDLSLVRQIRENLTLAIEELQAENPAIKSRSLAALATSLKVTQDVARKALRIDEVASNQTEELPTLTVQRLTDAEVQEIQAGLNDL